jgi:hypothetical protein
MRELALFLAGALLCNAFPHLAAGLRGEVFPTPFAKPRGKGPSSPLVNFLWGAFNCVAGLLLLAANPMTVGLNVDFVVTLAGALALGVYLSIHFGQRRN